MTGCKRRDAWGPNPHGSARAVRVVVEGAAIRDVPEVCYLCALEAARVEREVLARDRDLVERSPPRGPFDVLEWPRGLGDVRSGWDPEDGRRFIAQARQTGASLRAARAAMRWDLTPEED